jgi:hypothetical protein
LALHFAQKWCSSNDELHDAKGFFVIVYKTSSTGISFNPHGISEENMQRISEELNAEKMDVLQNVFSGLLPGRTNQEDHVMLSKWN